MERTSVLKKLCRPSNTVRMPHEGCHVSGWNEEILRQIFLLICERSQQTKEMREGASQLPEIHVETRCTTAALLSG